MWQRVDGALQVDAGHAVGPVLVALATLVFHHVALDVKPALVEGVHKEAHPVRLQPESKLQVVRRQVLPVVRPVGRGGAVEGCAHLLQRLEVAAVVVLGPLEHEVLEEVGVAGLAGRLVLGAYVIPDVDGHQRQGVVPVKYYVQPIRKGELLEFYWLHELSAAAHGNQQGPARTATSNYTPRAAISLPAAERYGGVPR